MSSNNLKDDNVINNKSLPTTHSGARRRLASAAIILMLAGLFLASRAFSKVIGNTIDGVAVVTDHGRHIIATGPLTCTHGERAFLRVTVTQRTTGAMAKAAAASFAPATASTGKFMPRPKAKRPSTNDNLLSPSP